ncbi:hypothetical protein MNBD_GAMMA22-147 [hydrothermal vent metagenome]|uniref:DUF302 domain-containing protein n=1 Tax=hydrothermal vent metagenome TaxID=652676 RepID=A0A3B1APB1_9ZZZZ
MRQIFTVLLAFASLSVSQFLYAHGSETGHQAEKVSGMITLKSSNSVKATLDKLETVLKKKGITIVTRWSHDDGANKVGIKLRKTELLIFGNPKLGSHFLTSKQTVGIDLPLKALAWEDDAGQVWLSYNDPTYIAKRHDIKDRAKIVAKMTGALKKLTSIAIK